MSIFGNFDPIGQVRSAPEVYTHSSEIDTGERLEARTDDKNFTMLLSMLVIFISLLVIRLLNLQVALGAQNLNLAEGNRIRIRQISAPRGMIYDSQNKPLLKNIARYDLAIIPADLPAAKAARQEVYNVVSQKFNQDISNQIKDIDKVGLYSIDPVILSANLTQEQALKYQVEFNDLAGVEVLTQPIRSYPDGKGLGHVLGYIGKISESEIKEDKGYHLTDWIGKTGLEKSYEKYLRGLSGQQEMEIDAHGRIQRIISNRDPVQGNDLNLSLDLDLQEATHNALKGALEKSGSSKGVAMALDPRNGGILSYVSLPDYNPNSFILSDKAEISRLFSDPNKPLLNRAISGTYASGSVIKPVYAAAGLEEKIISSSFSIDTPSEIKIGEFRFPDWKDHGVTDIRRAIAESNNIIFYAIGGGWDRIKGLGIKRMDEYLEKFGMGTVTGIDLPNEAEGFIPTPDWKKSKKKEPWYIGDTYHLAIGQGDLSVTPIQIANAITAIANDGRLIKPHLVSTIDNAQDRQIEKIEPQEIRDQPATKENLQIVREGMRQTVESGSARSIVDIKGLQGQDIQAAGKTGTAQTSQGDKTHAWFAGFAPWNDPKIALVVLVEEGGEGNVVAVPVAGEMFKTFFRDGNPALK